MTNNNNDFIKKLSTSVTTSAIAKIKEALSTVKELDATLTELGQTSSMTASQLEDFYYSANNLAKQLGTTTNAILTQAAAWSKLGYSIQDAKALTKSAAILDAISPDLELEQATASLSNILKAFKIDAEDSLDGIISKISVIGNTTGISNGDIIDILNTSASAMAEANNTLDQTIALGTAAVSLTGNAVGAGEALETLSLRLQGYNESTGTYTEDLKDLSDTIEDLTSTTASPNGISLFTDATEQTCKSTYQLLSDISKVWEDLSRDNQTQLLDALAGSAHTQDLSAMITNFDAASASIDSMAGSAGTAESQMAAVMDTITYKANALKETGTGIAQNLFGGDEMKTVVDGLTSVGEAIEWITDKIGLFGTLAASAGLFAGIKNVGRTKMSVLI